MFEISFMFISDLKLSFKSLWILGTKIFLQPILIASSIFALRLFADLNWPLNPNSPTKAQSFKGGIFFKLDKIEIATPKSEDGSFISKPPPVAM